MASMLPWVMHSKKVEMMKNKYLFGMLTMLIVALMSVCFTACGDDDDDDGRGVLRGDEVG